jgi:hypothetical protein
MKMDDELSNLPMTVRCYYALHRNDIQNLAELTKMTKSDLLKLPTIGKKCLEEIIEVLAEIGLSLSPGPEDKKQWDELGKRIDKQLKGFLAMKEDNTFIDPTWMQKTGGYAKDITLRDEFAGRAMQVLKDYVYNFEELSKQAYELADAMLAVRGTK